MLESSLGIASLTQKDFQDTFLNKINNPDFIFFKDLLRHTFTVDPEKRMKIETLLRKLKKERKIILNELTNKNKKYKPLNKT